ncbi:PucR family transcriptional regulator [Jatrophihabitans fulvus]
MLLALHRASGEAVRLVAADGALLCQVDAAGVHEFDGAQTFDADRPAVVSAAELRRAFAASGPVAVRCVDGVRTTAIAVRTGERRVGLLMVAAAGPQARAHLADVVTATAIVAVRRDAEAAAVAQTAAWFVDELRFGTSRDPTELTAVGRRFGVDLATEQVGVELHYDGTDRRMFSTALTWIETPVRHEEQRAWTVLPADAPDRAGLTARRLASMVGDGTVRVATGSPAAGATALRRSFARARFTMAHAIRTGLDGAVTFGSLGALGLLSDLSRDDLETFVRSRLGPVLDRAELLDTLRAWFGSGGSWLAVANRTHIHRNSVGHRLERIRSLLGVDPGDPAVALDLQVALCAADILASDP